MCSLRIRSRAQGEDQPLLYYYRELGNATSLAGVRGSHISSVVENLQSWNDLYNVTS
jgi:hypothetical protein